MNFLNAKSVRVVKHFDYHKDSSPIHTEKKLEQALTVSMYGITPPNLIELVVEFDDAQEIPKKLSLSANQFTLDPLHMDIKLVNKYGRKPYLVKPMEELRTMVDLEPTTHKLIFSFPQDKNEGKYAKMKLYVNYIAF